MIARSRHPHGGAVNVLLPARMSQWTALDDNEWSPLFSHHLLDTSMISQLQLDAQAVRKTLVDFLCAETARIGIGRVVVGLSGGVDSALVTFLAVEALGSDNVRCLFLPYKHSNPESKVHASLVAEALRLQIEEVDITPMVEPLFEMDPVMSAVRRGNIMARERMIVLYDRSARDGALVAGTGNKTEILLGYSTLHGDAACAINPIGGLYKTQVWQLAAHIGVPDVVIRKAPSADLWAGQTDESELGFTYTQADEVLAHLIDEKRSMKDLTTMGFNAELVERIQERIDRYSFKRMLPVIARVG
jgi:NAD+ synthase